MSDSDVSDLTSNSDEEHEEDIRRLDAVLEVDCPPENSLARQDTAETQTLVTSLHNCQIALSLNKSTDEKLSRLNSLLINRLHECRQRLNEVHTRPVTQKSDKQLTFKYVYCGKPYFRNRDNFPAPDNSDTLTMARSGMYDFSDVGSVAGWTVKDKTELVKQITQMSRNIRKKQLESKLAELKRKPKKERNTMAVKQQMIDINKQINKITFMPLTEELALPLDEEYCWDTIANALNHRHEAQEYQALWKLYLHPSINKKCWNKVEHLRLHQIATKKNFQNWAAIAAELNTARTGYQCFVYYRTNMGNTLTRQKWTKDEEEFLKRLINYYREDDYIPWGKVAAAMENRTKIQIYNKYARLQESRKGRFLPEEDAVLLNVVRKHGPNFKKAMTYLPGRSVAQLRCRYHILNNSTQTSVVWTIEEDKKLVQLMANQDSSRYINYAAITQFFPDKDRVQLRARYVTLVRWMKKHPNKDIAAAPRRGARRLVHGKGDVELTQAIQKLKTRIETEVVTKRTKKITRDSPEDAIDHAIITALINEKAREEEMTRQSLQYPVCDEETHSSNENINEKNLRKLLILLKASLNKDSFESSSYAEKYPGLKQTETEPITIKVKSYSKKAARNLITLDSNINPPDIWGNFKLTSSDYVLPPNYSTITGCRRLMALASKHNQDRNLNLQNIMKRSTVMKEQINLFIERFMTLFLWPMLLSNEGPREERRHVTRIFNEKHVKRREVLNTPVSVVIPTTGRAIVHDDIDLDETKNTEDNTTITLQKDVFMDVDEEDHTVQITIEEID